MKQNDSLTILLKFYYTSIANTAGRYRMETLIVLTLGITFFIIIIRELTYGNPCGQIYWSIVQYHM